MAADFALASAFDDAPQARSDSSNLVGLPFSSRSGPGLPAILARNEARRGLSPDFTGAFRLAPSVRLKKARPAAFNPPFGFWCFFATISAHQLGSHLDLAGYVAHGPALRAHEQTHATGAASLFASC